MVNLLYSFISVFLPIASPSHWLTSSSLINQLCPPPTQQSTDKIIFILHNKLSKIIHQWIRVIRLRLGKHLGGRAHIGWQVHDKSQASKKKNKKKLNSEQARNSFQHWHLIATKITITTWGNYFTISVRDHSHMIGWLKENLQTLGIVGFCNTQYFCGICITAVNSQLV